MSFTSEEGTEGQDMEFVVRLDKNTTKDCRSVNTKGYLRELTYEAQSYAAQLFTYNDHCKVQIVSVMSPDGKIWNTYATVPDGKSDFVDTIKWVNILGQCDHESQEASNEALVYDLYKELCTRIGMEDRLLPDCLASAGREACTREEYKIHLEHLRKEAQHQAESANPEKVADTL